MYTADITRTLPANGHFSPRQREIYDIVLGAQRAAEQAFQSGKSVMTGMGPDSLFRVAYEYMNSHGKDQHGQPLGQYFVHGLGHGVGLDVHDPTHYKEHKNPEGALVPANRAWHEANGTYPFAWGLGTVIVAYGLLIAAHPWKPALAAVGRFLVFLMAFVTLSFLITTPECWVPALGDAEHGFPYLSGAGRLVLKDAIMMGAALVTMADSARAYLRRRQAVGRQAAPEEREELAVCGAAR